MIIRNTKGFAQGHIAIREQSRIISFQILLYGSLVHLKLRVNLNKVNVKFIALPKLHKLLCEPTVDVSGPWYTDLCLSFGNSQSQSLSLPILLSPISYIFILYIFIYEITHIYCIRFFLWETFSEFLMILFLSFLAVNIHFI